MDGIQVFIDGDGAPRAVKDVVFRAAEKRGVIVTIVANRPLVVPKFGRIYTVKVEAGMDVADAWLVQNAPPGSLVITSDVPLAAELVEKGVIAINPRGETYTAANVRQALAMRDFMTEARESGMVQGSGPPPFDQRAVRAFSAAFDRWLSAAQRAEAKRVAALPPETEPS